MVKRSILTLSIILVTIFPIYAQQQNSIEYGDENDLRGVTKIFIDTKGKLSVQQNIVKNIRKKIPKMTIAPSEREAEVILIFSNDIIGTSRIVETITSDTTVKENGNSHTVETRTESPQTYSYLEGNGLVVIRKGGVTRLLLEFKDKKSGNTFFERDPSTNFARAFVKAYQKANK